MKVLTLNLKKEYFEQIKSGTKTEEFRLCKPYWKKRLEGQEYDEVHLCCGYPTKTDMSRRIILAYQGYTIKTIIHPHFGDSPVQVYAIGVGTVPATNDVVRW
jgi:hypothetical protein